MIASEICQHLQADGYDATLQPNRGLDHGAWVPMLHLLPQEEIPILQLSFDNTMSNKSLLELGNTLKVLRDKGIAVIASGSITHNLYDLQPTDTPVLAYADRFVNWVRTCVLERNTDKLRSPKLYNKDYKRAHPTDEHYVTLLIAMGATDVEDRLHILKSDMLQGALSMESYAWL